METKTRNVHCSRCNESHRDSSGFEIYICLLVTFPSKISLMELASSIILLFNITYGLKYLTILAFVTLYSLYTYIRSIV